MRGQVLSLTVGNRRVLTLLASLLTGMALVFGLVGIRTAETQTTPAPTTTYYDIEYLGDSVTGANDINDYNQVVGSLFLEDYPIPGHGRSHPFLYENDQMQDLGVLDGTGYGVAHGINSSGQVVGYSGNRAFLYDEDANPKMQDLGILDGFDRSTAGGINDSGQIVGSSISQDDYGNVTSRAFLYENGQMSPLGDDNATDTSSINESGQVVGYAQTDTTFYAFLYENGDTRNLGTLDGGYASSASDINNSGQVVGYSENGIWDEETGIVEYHAFLYENGEMTDLGALDGHDYSEASSINESGQVVGYSYSQSEYYSDRAFIYENGQMTDLNTLISPASGWTLTSANSINSEGQIAVSATKDGKPWHGLLLNPTATMPLPPAAPPTPVLDQASDTGASKTDNLTYDDTPTFTGTAAEGSTVKIYVNGVEKGSGTAAGGSYSITTSSLNSGEHNVSATASNSAGESQRSEDLRVTIDKTSPEAVTGLSAATGDAKADLSWTNTTDSDFDKVRVLRSTSGAATSPEPESEQTQVYEGTATSYSDTGLTNSTKYYYTVIARDKAGNWSSGASTNATPTASDMTAPTVDEASLNPSKLQTGVQRNTDITATFSEEMDPTTLETNPTTQTAPSVTLHQEYRYQVRKKVRGKIRRVWTYRWVPVNAASVSCDDPCKTAAFDPFSDLAANTNYLAVVTTGAKDKAGNALPENYSWTFTTGGG